MPRGFSEARQSPFKPAPRADDADLGFKDGSGALTATLRLGPGGRVVIPADMRDSMGLKQGDALLARLDGGALTMVTLAETVQQLQAAMRNCMPDGVSLVDELIADRRREAAAEED